jgi:arylsulfatase A-like enzyme
MGGKGKKAGSNKVKENSTMKAIMVMFDTLIRDMLPPYGGDWVKAPNFQRLADRSVTFNNSYVGSMPCMPARRDLHTGRYSFLHRSWGPIEPFDDSMPQLLKESGVFTHLVSDHYHYWEDGGCNYHTRYNSWEISRGQEGDPWKGEVKEPDRPDCMGVGNTPSHVARQDWINRKYMPTAEEHYQARTFNMGLEFISTNCHEDNWFLQIETFDPHEPFFTHQQYKDLYPHEYDGLHFDWPSSTPVKETPKQIHHVRMEYAALVSMCDEQLGRVLDAMDELELWKDTMLIVNTDHGYLLGEHGWWGKVRLPIYNEVANTPLFIWDPRSGRQGERCDSLVQMIDMAPTLLEYFGVRVPGNMQGISLHGALAANEPTRNACLFGVHGMHVNCTDERYVYMRAPVKPVNAELYEYTLMPTHMKKLFGVEELQNIRLVEPFTFTKGCRTMKIKSAGWAGITEFGGHLLFDLQHDPKQEQPLDNAEIEERMTALMVQLMKENDAPEEQFARLGLEAV